MTHFIRDDFKRDDGPLGSGWQVYAINGGGITISGTTAVGTVANGGTSFAIARSTATLGDDEQEASLSFVVGSAPASFRLGFHSKQVGGIQIAGFSIDCVVTSTTNVRLAIVTDPNATAVVQVPGTIQQVNKTPLLRDGGTCFDVVQELRAIVRRSSAGMELQVFLNQDDDSQPDIRWRYAADQVVGGAPYFGVWHGTSAVNARVGEVTFGVYRSLSARTADDNFPTDRPSLKELREDAIAWYERRLPNQPNLDTDIVDGFVNDSQRDLLNRLGDLAVFLRREEDISLEFTSPQRVAYLPRRVGRVLRIGPNLPGYDSPAIDFRVIGHGSDGRLKISLPWAGTSVFRILYEPVVSPLVGDEDRSVIPRDYKECVVAGVVQRMFRNEGNDKEWQRAIASFNEQFAVCRYALQRHQRSRMGPLRIVVTPTSRHWENWRGY